MIRSDVSMDGYVNGAALVLLKLKIPFLSDASHLHFQVIVDWDFAVEHLSELIWSSTKYQGSWIDIRPKTYRAKTPKGVQWFCFYLIS